MTDTLENKMEKESSREYASSIATAVCYCIGAVVLAYALNTFNIDARKHRQSMNAQFQTFVDTNKNGTFETEEVTEAARKLGYTEPVACGTRMELGFHSYEQSVRFNQERYTLVVPDHIFTIYQEAEKARAERDNWDYIN